MTRAPFAYRPKPGEIPTDPGVYRFRDADRRVLYVGKAKNLRARLSNYFAPLRTPARAHPAHGHHRGIRRVDRRRAATSRRCSSSSPGSTSSIRRSTCGSRTTSPTRTSPSPSATRRRAPWSRATAASPARRYFGPYPKVWAVNETLDLMLKAFPIRTCKDCDYKRAMASGKPCFAGQIGRCFGPCSVQVTIEEHRAIVDRLRRASCRTRTSASSASSRSADAGGRRGAWTTRPRRATATSCRRSTPFFEKSAVVLGDDASTSTSSASTTTSSRPPCSSSSCAAAASAVCARWTVDKELDVAARRARRLGRCRTPTATTTPPPARGRRARAAR